MAIIPLRQYNREIEGLIDTGQLDEAVAHCRHILETFPKHIATYRLLGKAYMEQQRYGDATDIFQRVLSSVPDDHVANIGLSIIREDEGNLDAAIWYMERALEAQPSNSAIKDELRRLYGRRDGIEPPKVRLTRGALARMYSRGGLYDQAVAELRAALADDPQRPDLMVLLAQMHYYLGQQVEAVDTCGTIMKQLPYCLIANRILASILPQTGRADDTKNFHQRAIAMDPYFSSTPPHALSADSVPESAINIERLEYRPGQADGGPAQPAWAASLGIAFEESQPEQLPEWLQDQGDFEEISKPDSRSMPIEPFSWETSEDEMTPLEEPTKVEDIIPDWMKEAGWQPASGEAVGEQASSELAFPSEQPTDEIVKAEIPDWLKDLAPSGALDEEPTSDLGDQGELDLPWLQKTTPGATDTIVNWLGAQKQPSEAEEVPESEIKPPEILQDKAAPPSPAARGENGGLPDWLQGVEASYGKSGITDWLKTSRLEEYEAAATPKKSPPEESAQAEEEIPEWSEEPEGAALHAEELPDWLKEMSEVAPKPAPTEQTPEEVALPAEELPDWLKEMGEGKPEPTFVEPPAAEVALPAEEVALPAEELPDWLKEMDKAEPEPTFVEPITEEVASFTEELPDWLEEMGASDTEPAPAEPTVIEHDLSVEEFPVQHKATDEPVGEIGSIESLMEELALPAEQIPDSFDEIGEPAGEIDFQELDVSEPTEELPEWAEEIIEPPVEIEALEISQEEPALPAEELPDWLKETGQLTPPEVSTPPAEGSAEEEPALADIEIPDWLLELDQPESTGMTASSIEPNIEDEASQAGEVPIWLKDTAELTSPDTAIEEGVRLESPEEIVEDVLPAEEFPEWLRELEEPAVEAAAPFDDQAGQDAALAWLETLAVKRSAQEDERSTKPEEPQAEMPDWVKDEETALPEEQIPAQPAMIEPAQPVEELSDWLKGMAETSTEQPAEEPSAESAVPFIDQSEQDAALAWLEKLAAQHGAKEEELITPPEDRRDTIPDWIKLGAEEAQHVEELRLQPAGEVEPASPAEELPDWLKEMAEPEELQPPLVTTTKEPILTSDEPAGPSEELPEWLQEMTEPAAILPPAEPVAEESVVTTEEPSPLSEELPEWLQELAEPTEEVVPEQPIGQSFAALIDVADQDAALAWLEGLAAQHGAKEEELITRPEERRETMPDWVKQEVGNEEEAEEIPTQPVPVAQPDLTEATIEQPEEQIKEQPELHETMLEPGLEHPVTEEPAPPAEELPDWLSETTAPGDALNLPEEQAEIEQLTDWLKETATPQQTLTGEESDSDLEKLPDWLRETDQVTAEEAETSPSAEQPTAPAWMPEAILPETELPIAPSPPLKVPAILEDIEQESPEQEPEPTSSELPPEPININTAPLSQLENLSGIGFVLGQRIISYREENGLFTEINDLMNVSGIGSVVIDSLRDRLTTGIPVKTEEEIPEIETEEGLFNQARKAVEKGDVDRASELYNQLIAQGADLEHVIGDMQDALYRFPLDINLWQSLGDAYLRTDKLQEALDAYTKAEELLR